MPKKNKQPKSFVDFHTQINLYKFPQMPWPKDRTCRYFCVNIEHFCCASNIITVQTRGGKANKARTGCHWDNKQCLQFGGKWSANFYFSHCVKIQGDESLPNLRAAEKVNMAMNICDSCKKDYLHNNMNLS